MSTLPLHSTHLERGAAFGDRNGRQVVCHYGAPLEEYRAAREAAVLVDLSFRDALRVTGEDRLSFLHGMCTNDITGLPEWGNVYAAMVTARGAMVSDLRAVRRPGDLVLDLEPGLYPKVREFLERYLISEDAELHDAAEDVAVLGLLGPKTAEVLKAALDASPDDLTADFGGEKVALLPSLLTRGPGVDLLFPRAKLQSLWAHLVDRGGPSGLRPSGVEPLEWLRVEDGMPRFGADLLETTIPLEADLARAIHYKKGCYVGQEIIARATFRGQVNKKLVGLLLGEAAPAPRAELRREGKKVGFVTTVVPSPLKGQHVALGYVHRDHLAAGTALEVAEPVAPATVQPLPFTDGPATA